MLEIEVKAPARDLREVEERLRAMKADGPHVEEQVDTYFAHPCRDFGKTDEAVRLRRQGKRSILTYKGPKIDSGSKTREEIEVDVPDPEAMATILERIGFTKVIEVRKVRAEYSLADALVCLDRVAGLGDYVEVEYKTQELERGKARVAEIMRSLGLSGNERRSYLELLMLR
jgi:adenylate cyclase class 2